MEQISHEDFPPPRPDELAALDRLVQIANSNTPAGSMAHGSTHQSMIVADFLLAWWDCVNCGHFDLTSLWAVDAETVADMQTVFAMIARVRVYPDSLGYQEAFKAIMKNWRHALEEEQATDGGDAPAAA
ncbi:MAG: hypothetical protein LBE06_08450 [Azoarcus sp.]|jgi:hypothetical protein|nr:hypothetical protein [Azoarcus sp.]